MNFLRQFKRMWQDPPPGYAFEFSPAGIAWSRRQKKELKLGFEALEPDVLEISPLKDNVLRPEALFEQVRALAPQNGKSRKRTAALILPDYCARIAVLDFNDFPSDKEEQESLVRFRMKKSIPFDLESAKVSYHVQSSGGGQKKYEVVAAVAALEIVARYEAALRSAGFAPGYVTTSALATLNLLREDGVRVVAKLAGAVLTAIVTDGKNLRLLRCVELPAMTPDEVIRVLFPTFAYAEDELGVRPDRMLLCGFGDLTDEVVGQCRSDLGVEVQLLNSRLGQPDETNAGLLGFLEANRR
jgi:type IV pilus assembly protein PilM